MRTSVLVAMITMLISTGVDAQWTNTNPDIHNTNTGNVGIGTSSPRGKFDVDGSGDVYLSDSPNTGSTRTIYLPGHIYIAPYNGSNVSYLQARRLNDAGTTSLQIRTYNSGSLTNAMLIAGDGSVGIGTTSPAALLHVNGSVLLGNSASSWTSFNSTTGGRIRSTGEGYLWLESNSSGTGDKNVYVLSNGGNIEFRTADTVRLKVLADGSVGIGTTLTSNPNGYQLAVNGKIGAKEIQVENSSDTWPDYVFDRNYKLPTLTEVEAFVKANKHLPEIPSAEEIKQNGQKIGEMNALLLKKVEELTLYMIDQQRQLDQLKKENGELKELIQHK